MLTWLKDNGPVIGAMAGTLVAVVAILQLVVVGPMNRRFDAQDRRIDDLRTEMNARFDAQDKYMNARFDAADQRFDAQDQRLDQLTREVSELRALVVGIIERVSRNEGEINIIREQLQSIAPAP